MVIGYDKVAVTGPPANMGGMTKHLIASEDVARFARYFEAGAVTVSQSGAFAAIRPDIHPAVLDAWRLGEDQKVISSADHINALISGKGADGSNIDGKHYASVRRLPVDEKTGERRLSYPIGSYIFSPAPHKSISSLWALANEMERAQILTALRDASREAMGAVANEIGRLRFGEGGLGSSEKGHLGWFEFQHLAARRVRRTEGADGVTFEKNRDPEGDPHIHIHFVVPNVLVGVESGKIGSLDTAALHGFLKHEADGIFHAAAARNLRSYGFAVDRDGITNASRATIIPKEVDDQFSKVSKFAEFLARKGAAERGEDWSELSDKQVQKRIRTFAETQRVKGGKDVDPQFASWRAQAEAIWGQIPETMREPDKAQLPELTDEERLRRIYTTASEILDPKFQEKAVLSQWEVRGAIAQAAIVHGYKNRSDIDTVTWMMRREGVLQYGENTQLRWGREHDARRISVSTRLHTDQEAEFVELVRKAAADRSLAIPPAVLDRALVGRDYSDAHGKAQLAGIRSLASGGRFGLVVAASGAGKTESLKPLVQAWREQDIGVHGASLAWSQADALTDTGILSENTHALSVMIAKMRSGELVLGARDVVAVDEWIMIGTRSGLELLRHRDRMGFSIVALGGDRQIGAVAEAGDMLYLSRRALGPEAVPEISTTRRQETDREKHISGLLRTGYAGEALKLKREDNTAEMADGYDAVVRRTAQIYRSRLEESGEAPIVLAPTNRDAHEVSLAIRVARREMGMLGKDHRTIPATDGERRYMLPISVGDHLRLFRSTGARYVDGHGGAIGRNHSIVEIVGIDDAGLMLKAKTGKVGYVSFERLRDDKSGRTLVAYGYSHTIHSAQGASAGDGIFALPDGSRSLDSEQGYSALTRHRRTMHLVTNGRAESAAVRKSRALNDTRPIEDEDRWAMVARAVSRETDRDTATAMAERVYEVREGGTQSDPLPIKAPLVLKPAPPEPTPQPAPTPPQVSPQVDAWARQIAEGNGYDGMFGDVVDLEFRTRLARVQAAGLADVDYDLLHEKAIDAVSAAIKQHEAEMDKTQEPQQVKAKDKSMERDR